MLKMRIDSGLLYGILRTHYDVTGYAYEPWHIRYVGEDLANYLYSNNMTLMNTIIMCPVKTLILKRNMLDLINYKPPITPTPIPEEELRDRSLLMN